MMKLTIEETNTTYTSEIEHLDVYELIEEFTKIMKMVGYHDVSIWRGLKHGTEQMEERLESIISTKDEWSEND